MRFNDNDYGGFVLGNPYEGDGVYNPFTNNSGVGGGGGTGGGAVTFNDTTGPRGGGISITPDVVVDPGGGGVVFIPPVKDDAPVFVPPTYTDLDLGSLNIHLIAEETAEFLKDDVNIGFGLTTKESYQPSLKFGNSKTYKANVEGKITKNYYQLRITKTNQTPDLLDYQLGSFGQSDFLVKPIQNTIGGLNFRNDIGFTKFDSPITNLKFNIGPGATDDFIKTPTRLDALYKEHIEILEFVWDEVSKTYVQGSSRTASKTGTIALNFTFFAKKDDIILPDDPPYPPDKYPIDPVLVNYNVIFVSNKTAQLGDFIKLNYQFVSNGKDILEGGGDVLLSTGNIDEQSVDELYLSRGTVNFNITESYETARLTLNNQNLPEGFGYTAFFYAPKEVYERTWKELNRADVTPEDYMSRGWTMVNKGFKVSGSEFLNTLAIAVIFEEKGGSEIVQRKPVVQLTDSIKEFEVKESDSDKVVTIPFTTSNAEFIDFYISESPIRIPAENGYVELSFVKDFAGEFGSKIVYFIPYNQFGRGDTVSTVVKFTSVNDFPSIIDITIPESIDVPVFSDLNVDFEVSYNTFAATSVDIFIIDGGNTIPLATAQPPKGSFNVNLRTLITQFLGGKQTDLTFKFIPYNRGGVRELVGNPYELTTTVVYPSMFLTEGDIKNSIFQAISDNLKFNDLGPDSKYLTHLLNFGNNEQILISSWEEDDWTLSEKVEDELGNLVVKNKVDTLLLKLYSPLSADITTNSTLWVTKLMSNPLIETVILNEQDNLSCPPIKGPNFNIDYELSTGFSTNLESLDTLLLSGSVTSSANLINSYLSSSKINTDDLNIEYFSGSNYLTGSIAWKNFVHFSSAKERVDNFIYKVQLIEAYENQINNASNTNILSFGSVSNTNEIERQTIKKNQIINGFDGFEKFLYTSESNYTTNTQESITWPYNNGSRLASTNNQVVEWYTNISQLAEEYDTENGNYVLNNIPQYIKNNTENDSLLLFFSMIGHHFDNIYFHTKSIEKSRGLGYKNKNGISDKLLFDILKSFSWNAKNLASDSDLWNYMFGLNGAGEKINTKSAKERTNEVWRRIINNLPYLLKNKGTRKGIYAIMACYGIPSSNLSILEFGGPEASKRFNEEAEDIGTTKLLMDNTTYALKMIPNSKIQMEWKTTDKGEKPKTIELFLKPAYAGDWTIISGSAGWKVQLSGSTDSEYGKIKYIDGGNTLIESALLPIFNQRFFGISVSSGSVGIKLDTKQVEKDRTIFENSYTTSVPNTFGPQTQTLLIGNNYSGSIDEVRLWSTTLSSSVFFRHVLFPEMVNGNHISSSTEDLYFRLDFEYPKNLNQTSSFINVDTNIYFSQSLSRNDLENGNVSIVEGSTIFSENTSALFSASAVSFPPAPNYPYNFEPVERTVALEIPNIGATRYSTNKIRFESQTDLNNNDVSGGVNLSIKNRATKKAFDQSPMDSNRIGLFFSPTKELNVDIAKSFGGINLDDYIGDPSDEYKSNYKELQKLRKYYFQRFDGRDVYQYINLIKSYEKSLFEDIKKMLPARVKATTGLLIEPHILERSTIEQSKPTGSSYQNESVIDTREHILTLGESNQYESIIDINSSKNLVGESNQYEANIVSSSIDRISSENYQYETPIYVNDELSTSGDFYQKEVSIDAKFSNGTVLTELDVYDINTVVGQSEYETIGFGIYAENGHAIRTYFDKEGRRIKERIKVDLIKEEKRRDVVKFNVVTPAGQGDPRGGTFLTSSIYYETKLNIQPYSGSKVINPGTGSIVEVTPLSGYLPTHYKNTSDLTTGMRNSYYLGSKNTAATTLDGTPPVETFSTNPNTLRVNKAGRDASEPILEVE